MHTETLGDVYAKQQDAVPCGQSAHSYTLTDDVTGVTSLLFPAANAQTRCRNRKRAPRHLARSLCVWCSECRLCCPDRQHSLTQPRCSVANFAIVRLMRPYQLRLVPITFGTPGYAPTDGNQFQHQLIILLFDILSYFIVHYGVFPTHNPLLPDLGGSRTTAIPHVCTSSNMIGSRPFTLHTSGAEAGLCHAT